MIDRGFVNVLCSYLAAESESRFSAHAVSVIVRLRWKLADFDTTPPCEYLGNIVEGLHADIKFERFMLLGLYIMMLDVSAWAFEITWLTMVNRPNCRKIEKQITVESRNKFAY